LQQLRPVLGSIVLLVCLAAGAVAAVILFVLVGPVPVNRRVTMVSRIQAPLPTAASAVAMPGMQVFDPAQAAFSPASPLTGSDFFTPPQGSASAAQHAPAIAQGTPSPDAAFAIEPPRPAPRKAKPLAPIAPMQLRRPRTAPSPLPRVRSARGTEPRPSQFDVEHTAPEAPMFDADEVTFLEDAEGTAPFQRS
jgi:hypothetical protein